jgi:hypothetical protein
VVQAAVVEAVAARDRAAAEVKEAAKVEAAVDEAKVKVDVMPVPVAIACVPTVVQKQLINEAFPAPKLIVPTAEPK